MPSEVRTRRQNSIFASRFNTDLTAALRTCRNGSRPAEQPQIACVTSFDRNLERESKMAHTEAHAETRASKHRLLGAASKSAATAVAAF
ncbi:hypothetical protein, partial [Mesorhizobium sp.]|uniref:hypothetical protein n=1 Tax=Mesorhizobium sp. TaxID=1871066 RepID=UPI0025B89D0C